MFTVRWRELRNCQMDLTMTEALAVVNNNNGIPPLEPDTAPTQLAEALQRMGGGPAERAGESARTRRPID